MVIHYQQTRGGTNHVQTFLTVLQTSYKWGWVLGGQTNPSWGCACRNKYQLNPSNSSFHRSIPSNLKNNYHIFIANILAAYPTSPILRTRSIPILTYVTTAIPSTAITYHPLQSVEELYRKTVQQRTRPLLVHSPWFTLLSRALHRFASELIRNPPMRE